MIKWKTVDNVLIYFMATLGAFIIFYCVGGGFLAVWHRSAYHNAVHIVIKIEELALEYAAKNDVKNGGVKNLYGELSGPVMDDGQVLKCPMCGNPFVWKTTRT